MLVGVLITRSEACKEVPQPELHAGKVSFDGTAGWHQALQEFTAMNDAGCFQPGVTGTLLPGEEAQFAEGEGLMAFVGSGAKGSIDAANPQFTYSFHPFPGGADPIQSRTLVTFGNPIAVNAHASVEDQAAAQTFIDFIARPKQNALFAQIGGALTQHEFLKEQVPAFKSSFATVFKDREYVLNPDLGAAGGALETNGIGLLTGHDSVDDVLNAMDPAWKQSPP